MDVRLEKRSFVSVSYTPWSLGLGATESSNRSHLNRRIIFLDLHSRRQNLEGKRVKDRATRDDGEGVDPVHPHNPLDFGVKYALYLGV